MSTNPEAGADEK